MDGCVEEMFQVAPRLFWWNRSGCLLDPLQLQQAFTSQSGEHIFQGRHRGLLLLQLRAQVGGVHIAGAIAGSRRQRRGGEQQLKA